MQDQPSRLCPDEPADHDAFGGHLAIAQTIKRLIETNPDRGYGIALIGARGSGKSTVIKLLEKGCGNTGILVFKFDAWAHEGDKLRRAFLEELCAGLQHAGWIRGWWPAKFRRRLKERASRSSSGLTLAAIFLAIWLAITPSHLAVWDQWMAPHIWGYWGILGAAVFAMLLQSRWPDLQIPLLYRSASVSVSAPAASSVEFREQFGELMAKSDLDKSNRTLVVALDDLDRLNEADRRKAEAVMRTFSDANATDSGALKRIWTIAPFRSSTTVVQKSKKTVQPDEGPLEKICQIRFVVPPPLVTDWRGFLDKKIQSQLPAWGLPDRDLAVRIYSECLTLGPLGTTPRRLGAFVNQIVAIETLRLYSRSVSLDSAIRLAANTLRLPGAFGPVDIVRGGPSSDGSEIAALWLNRDQGDALQALFASDVLGALRSGNVDELAKLSTACPAVPTIALALIEASIPRWAADEPHILGNAAIALEKLDGDAVDQSRQLLAKSAARVERWKGFDPAAPHNPNWLKKFLTPSPVPTT